MILMRMRIIRMSAVRREFYPVVVVALGRKPLRRRGNLKRESKYINQYTEIGTDQFCKDTEKSAGDVKKRQNFVVCPVATCCCLAPMYDRI